MTDLTPPVDPRRPWLRAAAASAAVLALAACDAPPVDKRIADETAPSTEWTATDPADPAVPVDLPEAEMTNVPAGTATPAASPSAAP